MCGLWKPQGEEVAAEALNVIVADALAGDRSAQNYLRKLWDNESWQGIKKKLETEGSVWYVWWMDGVRQQLSNISEVKA